MMTRSQVAKRIGRSVATVRRMEGRSLHPQYGPRGVRLFDADEVDDVAAHVAESGRALDGEGPDFSGSCSSNRRDSHSMTKTRRDLTVGSEISRLERLLQKTKLNHASWRARVEDAVESVVTSAPATDEDFLLALEDLIAVLRTE